MRGDASLEEDELAKSFYSAFSGTLKQRFAGWTAFFFTADLGLPKLLRLKEARKTPFFNGALECRLFRFDMVAGFNRKPAATVGSDPTFGHEPERSAAPAQAPAAPAAPAAANPWAGAKAGAAPGSEPASGHEPGRSASAPAAPGKVRRAPPPAPGGGSGGNGFGGNGGPRGGHRGRG